MSCEVFCSEILEVLQVLVEGSDGKHFSKLFSFLDLEPPLDHHLAGYFEKVSELLFRRMTVPVMRYVNTQGMKLLQSFLRHMDNYSIMQIVQRLLLPHIPFSITAETESMSPADAQNYQCNWSYSEETCNLLCARMLGHGNVDVPSHISDLLITVLQLSPAEALILSHLCRRPCVEAIISASIVDNADTASAGDTPTSVQSVSLAAISVLESMVLRLGESTGPFTDENRPTSPEEQQVQQQIRDNLETFLTCLQPFLPTINDQLRLYASTQPCGMLMGQTKTPYPRLGHRGLQLVKFVESLVRLSNTNFDIQLCESGVIRSATDLIFVYDLNSILHLSIQRIVLMIIEGGPARRMIQQHLLVDCGMLQRVIDRIERQINEATASSHPNSYTRVPSLGHLIHIVQVLHLNFSNEHFNAAVRQEEEELMEKFSAASLHSSEAPMTEGSSSIEASNGDKSDSKNNTSESQAADKAPTTTSAETDSAAASATEAREEVASEYPTTVSIHSILEGAGLLDTWQDFVQTLVQYLESQASFQGGEGDYEGVGNNAQMDMALQRLQNQMGSGGSWSVKVSCHGYRFYKTGPLLTSVLPTPHHNRNILSKTINFNSTKSTMKMTRMKTRTTTEACIKIQPPWNQIRRQSS